MDNELFLREALLYEQDERRLEKILLLQRLIRSHYVRRQFQQVRNEYFKTMQDIEGEIIKPIETIPIKPMEIIPKKEEPSPKIGTTPIWCLIYIIIYCLNF